MLMSSRLAEAISAICPARSILDISDAKALFGLAFKDVMGVRLHQNDGILIAIQEDVSGQGENAKWRNVVRFPLVIGWEVKRINKKQVIFQPTLKNCIYQEGIVSTRLDATLRGIEPEKSVTLSQPAIGIQMRNGIVYCFADETTLLE